jgi:hypothetical protein
MMSKIQKNWIWAVLLSVLIFLIGKESYFTIYSSKMESRFYNVGFYYLAQNPLNAEYDSDSFLFPFHFYLFSIKLSPENFVRYCKYILLVTTSIISFYTTIAYSFFAGFFFGFFLIISPVFLVQYTMVAFPDHFTFLFAILSVMFFDLYAKSLENRPVLHTDFSLDNKKFRLTNVFLFFYLIFLLLGFWTHFYQFLILSFCVLCVNAYSLYWEIFSKQERKYSFSIFINKKIIRPFLYLFGVAVFAKVSSYAIFYILQIPVNERRLTTIAEVGWDEWVRYNRSETSLTLLSFMNGLVFLLIRDFYRKHLQMLFILLVCLSVTFFTLDSTRVFTMLFYPAWIFLWIQEFRNSQDTIPKRKLEISVLLILGFLYVCFVPLFYKWGDKIIFLR